MNKTILKFFGYGSMVIVVIYIFYYLLTVHSLPLFEDVLDIVITSCFIFAFYWIGYSDGLDDLRGVEKKNE